MSEVEPSGKVVPNSYEHCASRYIDARNYLGSESDKATDADIRCVLRKGHRTNLCTDPLHGREWMIAYRLQHEHDVAADKAAVGPPSPHTGSHVWRLTGPVEDAAPSICERCGLLRSPYGHAPQYQYRRTTESAWGPWRTDEPDCAPDKLFSDYSETLRLATLGGGVHADPLLPKSTPRPFDANAVCPKCTSSDVTVQHCASGTFHCNASLSHYPQESRYFADDAAYAQTHEHMHRECRRCGFPWLEKVAALDVVRAADDRKGDSNR